jgi:hypothetical protein
MKFGSYRMHACMYEYLFHILLYSKMAAFFSIMIMGVCFKSEQHKLRVLTLFWDVMLWIPVEVHQCLGGTYCLQIQGRRLGESRNQQEMSSKQSELCVVNQVLTLTKMGPVQVWSACIRTWFAMLSSLRSPTASCWFLDCLTLWPRR